MDDRMKERVQEFVEQLLREEKSSIRKAQTLLEIENQAMEIGDELVRQLANRDLSERAEETSGQEQFFCPTCGCSCSVEQDPEPLILQGQRSEIEYCEPRCYCRSCRRSFFPNGCSTSTSRS